MGKSRSRLAADWFAKLRVNAITQEVEHEDVVAEQEAIAAAEAKIASDIVTAKALADSEMATAIAGATMASSDILTSLKTVDGSGSGLDADLLDGQHASAFATAAQGTTADNALPKAGGTMTGALTASGGISGLTLAHGISGSNFDISGVNQLTINDPGEGIVFTGSTNVSLAAIDDATDSIMNFSGASELRVNNSKVWHAGNDGSGSGLDADLLDGKQGSYYSPTSHTHSYLPLAGGTMTGVLVGRNCTTTTVAAANDTGSMSIRGSTTTPAVVSFHRAGAYAINFGLSTANKMEMGGWSASTIKHTWDMSGNYTAVGNITAYSDIRVKTNIDVIPEALDKVKQLSGYTFDRTDFIPDAETGVMPETRQTGVIAQEVLKVLPEAVTTMDDGKYAVAYGNMVGLLIEAIKELSAKVEELENK